MFVSRTPDIAIASQTSSIPQNDIGSYLSLYMNYLFMLGLTERKMTGFLGLGNNKQSSAIELGETCGYVKCVSNCARTYSTFLHDDVANRARKGQEVEYSIY